MRFKSYISKGMAALRGAVSMAMLSLIVAGCADRGSEVGRDFYSEIRSADKMVLASMSITKTVRTDRTSWYKIGKRIAVYSYDTYMQAYIDMAELRPSDLQVDESAKTVRLTLPPVKTQLAGRDMQMRKVYENIGIFRSDIDSRERAEMKERANASLLKEVEESPVFRQQLRESAENKARAYFTALLESDGYTATVDFRQ